mgnify:CR=1 FL=1
MDKTIAVEIERLIKHRALRQSTSAAPPSCWRTTRITEAGEGDTVSIAPCRPLSRRKSYKLVSVVEKRAPNDPVTNHAQCR